MTRATVPAAVLMSLAVSACSAAPEGPRPATGLRLVTVMSGLESPVHLASPTGDPRIFVVEQPGRIRIFTGGRLLSRPFLDLTDRVGWGGERGLLSVAFHPRYAENGFFFVNYTDRRGDTRIERYRVSADRDRADPTSARLLLHIRQPYANHNGGLSAFGPDGMLWIGMGDGGSGGDPHGHGQNPRSLLGKMLRIDVDRGTPYAIPASNPFRGSESTRPEIWATGLRNPWRFAFDEGLLYIADVGQNRWEEIDVVETRRGGLDFGWNRREGAHPFRPGRGRGETFTEPVVEYPHAEGCSVTGGLVYRGRRMPSLAGHYFYGDYCTGWIRSFRWRAGRVTEHREWRLGVHPEITSFGEDSAGELYVLGQDGTIHRLEEAR